MKRCGLYLRVSTERQAMVKEGSLDTQLDTLNKWLDIKNRSDGDEWAIAAVYREEGKSGKNTDRPEYQRMLEEIRAGNLDAVLCTKIDRITRSLIDFYQFYEVLNRHQVEFVSISESWDTSTSMGRCILKVALAFAELEREQTAERTKLKMHWRAEQGLWNGGQVLGYDLDPQNKGILKVNDSEAQLVRLIFDHYRLTNSYRKTAAYVNGLGYRTKSYKSRKGMLHGGKKFDKKTVQRILSNPIYTGKITYEDQVYAGKHPPIIEPAIWQDVNAILVMNKAREAKPRERNLHQFLLEGLVRCGICGNGNYMTPTYAKGRSRYYFYYQCTAAYNGADECQKRVNANALEHDVIENCLANLATATTLPAEIGQAAIGMAIQEHETERVRLDTHRQSLTATERQIHNLIQAIALGKSAPILIAELVKLEQKKQELLAEITRLETKLAQAKAQTAKLEQHPGSLDWSELWHVATPEERQEWLRLWVRTVTWKPGEVQVGLFFGSTFGLQAPPITTEEREQGRPKIG